MKTIKISRILTGQILLNKNTIQNPNIKLIPFADTKNKKYIEEISGNQCRTIKRYPQSYDFFANIFAQKEFQNNSKKIINAVNNRDYYEIWIKNSTIKNYYQSCGNHTEKQSLRRQLLTEPKTGGFVKLHKQNSVIITEEAPFKIMARRLNTDGTVFAYKFFLHKLVFESIVENKCKGDGFIEIPKNLYPSMVTKDKGTLQSWNPPYKANILCLLKNTHKKPSIIINTSELMETIFPEYYVYRTYNQRKKKLYKKITNNQAIKLHAEIIDKLQTTVQKVSEGFLVSIFMYKKMLTKQRFISRNAETN